MKIGFSKAIGAFAFALTIFACEKSSQTVPQPKIREAIAMPGSADANLDQARTCCYKVCEATMKERVCDMPEMCDCGEECEAGHPSSMLHYGWRPTPQAMKEFQISQEQVDREYAQPKLCR